MQSQQAKDIVKQKARWAAERWRRMKHEEQQEEKRNKEQEEIRKRMEEVDRKYGWAFGLLENFGSGFSVF